MSFRSGPHIALRSLEGQVYHVDLSTLLKHSGLFQDVLSLPQPTTGSDETVNVYERDSDLQDLLSLMQGGTISAWTSFHHFSSALRLADKWDCIEIMAQLRRSLSSTPFTAQYPLQIFGLARYFGWKEEARFASAASLSVDFDDPATSSVVDGMQYQDCRELLSLRQKRCEIFQQMLDTPQRFPTGNEPVYFCDSCCNLYPQDDSWGALKRVLVSELKSHPCGKTVLSFTLNSDDQNWVEAEGCWTASCPSKTCNAPRFDKSITLRLIRACLESLPNFID